MRQTSPQAKQLTLIRAGKTKFSKAYGGDLLKTREGRSKPRPISDRKTMHLVLRSTQARGEWSFKRPRNERSIANYITKFSKKYGVRIMSLANVGNHLHLQIKLGNRHTYAPFIRAVTGAIARHVMMASRPEMTSWTNGPHQKMPFWDRRPYTRIVESFKAILNLRDYIQINRLEGYGYSRGEARYLVKIKGQHSISAANSSVAPIP